MPELLSESELGVRSAIETDRQRLCLRKVDYRTRYHITGSAGEKEVVLVASHYTTRHLPPNDRHLALDQNRPHLRIDILILDSSNIYIYALERIRTLTIGAYST